jgi:hypothetical protein
MTIVPTHLINGKVSRVWDAGYQSFFSPADNHKVSAFAERLSNMRCFNAELRLALGVPTYYNEALGSTCQATKYDRVQGRPGDVTDKSVGIKTASEHYRYSSQCC